MVSPVFKDQGRLARIEIARLNAPSDHWNIHLETTDKPDVFRLAARVDGRKGTVFVGNDKQRGQYLQNGERDVTMKELEELLPYPVLTALITAYNAMAAQVKQSSKKLSQQTGVMNEAVEDAQKSRDALQGFVQALGDSNIKLRAEVLLEKDGQPTALYQAIIDAGQETVNGVFREENWLGADKGELKAVLKALPEEMHDAIPNHHALLAAVGKQNRVAQR